MKKKIIWASVVLVVTALLVVFVCECLVMCNAMGRTYSDIGKIPHRQVGVVLGTSPISTWTGRRNLYFDHRIKSAFNLYNAGKIDHIIVSGGDYRQYGGYDEPIAMRDSLVGMGVPAEIIILDYDGTRTLNSIAKIKDVYDIDSVTIISQEYHNDRALYQARYLGVDAIAYNARTPVRMFSGVWMRNRGRECLARVKLFVDIISGVKPVIKDTIRPELLMPTPALLEYDEITTKHCDLL